MYLIYAIIYQKLNFLTTKQPKIINETEEFSGKEKDTSRTVFRG